VAEQQAIASANGAFASPPRPSSKSKAKSSTVKCPVCSSHDRIDKVSNVVRSGRGRLYWENGEVAHYETELSQLLDAPARPREVPWYRALLQLLPPLLVLAVILTALTLLRAQDYVTIPENAIEMARNIGVGWFALVVPVALIARYVKSRFDLRKKLPVWIRAQRRWTGLYYCARDDMVFLPQVNAQVEPQEMEHLLYMGHDAGHDAGLPTIANGRVVK
jgi:hypothetical protein